MESNTVVLHHHFKWTVWYSTFVGVGWGGGVGGGLSRKCSFCLKFHKHQTFFPSSSFYIHEAKNWPAEKNKKIKKSWIVAKLEGKINHICNNSAIELVYTGWCTIWYSWEKSWDTGLVMTSRVHTANKSQPVDHGDHTQCWNSGEKRSPSRQPDLDFSLSPEFKTIKNLF